MMPFDPLFGQIEAPFEIKFAQNAPEGTFSGYGSYFDVVDSHRDRVANGAFKDTLKDWRGRNKLPKMLNQHGGRVFGGSADDLTPIGKWTKMEEDSKGLYCEGYLFGLDTDSGKIRHQAMKEGELDGLSIGYRVKREDIDYDDKDSPIPLRTLKKIELNEVSVVTFGSNPKTLIDNVKSLDIDAIHTLSDAEDLLREAGFTKKQALEFVSRFKKIARREAVDDQDAGRLLESILATQKIFNP